MPIHNALLKTYGFLRGKYNGGRNEYYSREIQNFIGHY
jgi:hypothetical protein